MSIQQLQRRLPLRSSPAEHLPLDGKPMTENRTTAEQFLYVLPWTMAGALVTALVYAVARFKSLPADDLAHAHGHPLLPFAVLVFGGISGVLAFPLAFVFLRRASLPRATLVSYGSVLLWVVVATPLGLELGWFGSYIVLALALWLCSEWSWVSTSRRRRSSAI